MKLVKGFSEMKPYKSKSAAEKFAAKWNGTILHLPSGSMYVFVKCTGIDLFSVCGAGTMFRMKSSIAKIHLGAQ